MNINLLDWFGYLASFIILVSLLSTSIIKLRWINVVGAALFTVYGFLISSIPTALMNAGIVVIDIYFLIKIYSSKEYFQILEFTPGSNYFNSFLDFYKNDINTFFGDKTFELNSEDIGFYVLRDMVPASVFLGKPIDEKTLEVDLDFAVPAYRDFKIGDYIYNKHQDFFKSHGYNRLIAKPVNESHEKYLVKMGFTKSNDYYQMNIK